jgi:hypothetical protein
MNNQEYKVLYFIKYSADCWWKYDQVEILDKKFN